MFIHMSNYSFTFIASYRSAGSICIEIGYQKQRGRVEGIASITLPQTTLEVTLTTSGPTIPKVGGGLAITNPTWIP